MNNNLNNDNFDVTANFINETYDKLSYLDLYGNSVIIFIFITLFVFVIFSYCNVMQSKDQIANDWTNQRCKPQNMVVAGFITHPEGKSAIEYTSENFQYCVQNILTNIIGYALEPFQFMMSSLTNIFKEMTEAVQQIRGVFNKLRNGISDFASDVLNRILNVMIPIQKIFIAVMDSFNKVQGIMVSGLYTMLGSYYTLQTLMGAILELIVKILVALVIVIAGLWLMPFSWPVATSMTAVFLAISVPLAIITYFMTEVMHIKSSAIPSLRCFDERTHIFLENRTYKYIKDIKPGDSLIDGSIVTAKIKVLSKNLEMYNLNGIVVSESHIVKYKEKWIKVKQHPEAKRINYYDEPYLYCLNTTSKQIVLNNMIFTDWDEIYDESLEYILNYKGIEKPENISKKLDYGYNGNMKIKLLTGDKKLKKITVGDILNSGDLIYGMVELKKNNLGKNDVCIDINDESECLYNLLVSNKYFQMGSNIYPDYNYNIDSILETRPNKNII
uniref:Vint domain-containing protein n=1 Tax=viral metagenome TaxID=1070528 RepID=A0A6C0KQZ5_9ZZZZ